MTLKSLDVAPIVDLARRAGEAALRYYGGPVEVRTKEDASPLTRADEAAHEVIVAGLESLAPGIPIVSEEGAEAVPHETRRDWPRFWLVDPLDGTKEFIRGTGQFTVNIALIEDGRPVTGVVHAPAIPRTYFAFRGGAAYRSDEDGAPRPVRVGTFEADRPVIVASRDHAGPVVRALLARLEGAEKASMGSSLKFCMVAEGAADLYLRDVPTMEWDTAAAQCVVEEAGGAVLTLDGAPLAYNKPVLRNESIVTRGDPGIPWPRWLAEAGAGEYESKQGRATS